VRVAVTGAGGYVGRALVARLEAAGHEVACLVRGVGPACTPGRRVVAGDVRSGETLDLLLEGADAVAHLAAFVHRSSVRERDRRECFEVNLGGTRALIEAVGRRGRPLPLAFVSTAAVYGGHFERASESTPCHPETAYAQSKLAAEQEVLKAARAGTLHGVVLRPALVIGPGAPGNVARLEGWMRRGLAPLAGAGGSRSMVHVDDLASAIAAALDPPPQAAGALYNVAGEPPLTVEQMVACLARGAGRPPRVIRVPGPLADLAAGLSRAASRWSGGLLPDLRPALEVYRATGTLDAAAIGRDLGLTFRSSERALEAIGTGLIRS